MNYIEKQKISKSLECHHGIFQKFWSIMDVRFFPETHEGGTIQIEYNRKTKKITLVFSKKFWDARTEKQKQFLICHEMMHLCFSHLIQYGFDDKNQLVLNICNDIVINELLFESFGFDKKELCSDETFAPMLKDNVFGNLQSLIPEDYSSNELYNLYMKHFPPPPQGQSPHHSFHSLSGEDLAEINELMKKELENSGLPLEQFNKELKNKGLELKEKKPNSETTHKKAGTEAGNSFLLVNTSRIVYKKKWETIIKKWVLASRELEEGPQWIFKDRRYECLPPDIVLQSNGITDKYKKNRLKVALFLDTSGSCSHLAERFFQAAESMPPDRFEVDVFCFDTEVYPTKLKTKELFGFGGTSFSCINDYIESNCPEKHSAYFIITDGMGDEVSPKNPEKWFWFLSENYKDLIPKKSKVFMLENFE
jgi:hypothetical protein